MSWLSKGQLIFLILLWLIVVGNFERVLVVWGPSRLLTEWGIYVNALLATILVLLVRREQGQFPVDTVTVNSFQLLFKKSWQALVIVVILLPGLLLLTNRMIYQYPSYDKLDKKSYHMRFGTEASWGRSQFLRMLSTSRTG